MDLVGIKDELGAIYRQVDGGFELMATFVVRERSQGEIVYQWADNLNKEAPYAELKMLGKDISSQSLLNISNGLADLSVSGPIRVNDLGNTTVSLRSFNKSEEFHTRGIGREEAVGLSTSHG